MAVILIADDSPEIRALYGACLRQKGHSVLEAADGRDAVAMVRESTPDLLLLDIWMPHLNGFEVLDELRHDPSSAHLRVVLLSILADGEGRLEAFSAGAIDYLVKGLGIEEFLSRIDSILAQPVFPTIADPSGQEARDPS